MNSFSSYITEMKYKLELRASVTSDLIAFKTNVVLTLTFNIMYTG